MKEKKPVRNNFKSGRFFLLQGEKSTGKTYEAVKRAAYLSTDYCLYSEDNILFITSDDKNKIKDTYNNFKDNSSNLTFFSSIDNSFEVLSINELTHKHFTAHERSSKKTYKFVEGFKEREAMLLEGIEEVKVAYPKSKLLNKENTKFLLEEIDYIRANKLETLEAYQGFIRKGRGKKVPKNSSSREAIYKLLKVYEDRLISSNLVDSFAKEALVLKEAEKNSSEKYTHIFIDNSEILTGLQLKVVRKLLWDKPYSNFVIVENKVDNIWEYSYFNSHKSIKGIDGEKYKTIKFKEKLEPKEEGLSIDKLIEVNTPREADSLLKIFVSSGEETLREQSTDTSLNEKDGSLLDVKLDEKKRNETLLEQEMISEKKKMRNLYMDYFNFRDIRHKMEYDFAVDSGSSREVILDPNGSGETLGEDELRSVPVYSDIAAGEPILISDEFEGNFSVPTYWLKGVKDAFMLKVKGDSMIGANIHHGDYVLIRQQAIANNNDIVAVDLDGNATLKRLSIKKDGIFLLPENPKYDPIKIESEDTMIMGTAIGVISKR